MDCDMLPDNDVQKELLSGVTIVHYLASFNFIFTDINSHSPCGLLE